VWLKAVVERAFVIIADLLNAVDVSVVFLSTMVRDRGEEEPSWPVGSSWCGASRVYAG
jgi:hypothetical protein